MSLSVKNQAKSVAYNLYRFQGTGSLVPGRSGTCFVKTYRLWALSCEIFDI